MSSKIIAITHSGTATKFSYPGARGNYGLNDANIPFKPSQVRIHSVFMYDTGTNQTPILLYSPTFTSGQPILLSEGGGFPAVYGNLTYECMGVQGANTWEFELLTIANTAPALSGGFVLTIIAEILGDTPDIPHTPADKRATDDLHASQRLIKKRLPYGGPL